MAHRTWSWRRWRAVAAAGCVFVLLALGCQRSAPVPGVSAPDPSEPPWFEDITAAAGLDFNHDAGPIGNYFLPQIMGSGAALVDVDQDGRLDLYLIHNAGPESKSTNRLFRQKENGTFEDVSAGSGLDVAGYGMGVAVGDVNNDGWPDVLLTGFRGVRLFINDGNWHFTEVTKTAGLDNAPWATAASFVDYDRDGWLDLVVVNYVEYDPTHRCTGPSARPDYCHPSNFKGTITNLFRNRGPDAKRQIAFDDVTLAAGLAMRRGPGLGILCADFNGDHWPDLFVANDGQPNHLWINQKNGTFQEEALQRGCAVNSAGRAEANMGVVFGDVDGDGLADLLVTHLAEETHTLWKQGPAGLFTDRTLAAGLTATRWRGTGFGAVLADFNQDGHLDLALANGRVGRPVGASTTSFAWSDYAERNQVLAGDGQGRFRDISAANPALTGTPRLGRGLCGGDICGQGRTDLLITHANGPTCLYRNIAPQAGHWLLVRAIVPSWNRDAYGALVTVTAGEQNWTRLIQPGSSYLCSQDPRAHFGLGAVDRIDSVRVTWPDGAVEDFSGGAVDRRMVLRKGDGHMRK